jgi:ubiquinone/menaquinone biosynthesis C-methylase UbiE
MPLPLSKIKSTIQSNFDNSVDLYEDFEDHFGLFEHLTEHLITQTSISNGQIIIDVGCGTGISTLSLVQTIGPAGTIFAIDLSQAMLERAKDRLKDYEDQITLIASDACSMSKHIGVKVDRILFTASIFLIPDAHQVLINCFELIKAGGILGFNYLDKILVDGAPLKDVVKEQQPDLFPYGRGVVDVSELDQMSGEAGFSKINDGVLAWDITTEEATAFYTIPAQSAGLYPRETYKGRREKVAKLFEFAGNLGDLQQCWGWYVGEKRQVNQKMNEEIQ